VRAILLLVRCASAAHARKPAATVLHFPAPYDPLLGEWDVAPSTRVTVGQLGPDRFRAVIASAVRVAASSSSPTVPTPARATSSPPRAAAAR
jgi:hypothetical protein